MNGTYDISYGGYNCGLNIFFMDRLYIRDVGNTKIISTYSSTQKYLARGVCRPGDFATYSYIARYYLVYKYLLLYICIR